MKRLLLALVALLLSALPASAAYYEMKAMKGESGYRLAVDATPTASDFLYAPAFGFNRISFTKGSALEMTVYACENNTYVAAECTSVGTLSATTNSIEVRTARPWLVFDITTKETGSNISYVSTRGHISSAGGGGLRGDCTDGQFAEFDTATGEWICATVAPGAGIANVVDDTSPEIGGVVGLDMNELPVFDAESITGKTWFVHNVAEWDAAVAACEALPVGTQADAQMDSVYGAASYGSSRIGGTIVVADRIVKNCDPETGGCFKAPWVYQIGSDDILKAPCKIATAGNPNIIASGALGASGAAIIGPGLQCDNLTDMTAVTVGDEALKPCLLIQGDGQIVENMNIITSDTSGEGDSSDQMLGIGIWTPATAGTECSGAPCVPAQRAVRNVKLINPTVRTEDISLSGKGIASSFALGLDIISPAISGYSVAGIDLIDNELNSAFTNNMTLWGGRINGVGTGILCDEGYDSQSFAVYGTIMESNGINIHAGANCTANFLASNVYHEGCNFARGSTPCLIDPTHEGIAAIKIDNASTHAIMTGTIGGSYQDQGSGAHYGIWRTVSPTLYDDSIDIKFYGGDNLQPLSTANYPSGGGYVSGGDMSKSIAAILPGADTLPATCTLNEIHIDTDATSGSRIYVCEDEDPDTWVLQGGAAAGDISTIGSATVGAACESGVCFEGSGTEDNVAVIGNFKVRLDADQSVTPDAAFFEVENGGGTDVMTVSEGGVVTGTAFSGTWQGLTGVGTASLQAGTTSSDGSLLLYTDNGGTDGLTIIQSATSGTNVLTLPADDGDAGEQLQTNGSGVLTWEAAGAGSTSYFELVDLATDLVQPTDDTYDFGIGYDGAGSADTDWAMHFNEDTGVLKLNVIDGYIDVAAPLNNGGALSLKEGFNDGTATWTLKAPDSGLPGDAAIVHTLTADGSLPVSAGGLGANYTGTAGVMVSDGAGAIAPDTTPALGTPSALVLTNATGSLDLGTGTIRGGVSVESTSGTPHSLAAAEGQWLFVTGAHEVDLPAVGTSGQSACLYATTANIITIDPNGTDVIVLNGTAESAGEAIDSTAAAGSFICILSNGTNWYTLGSNGTWTGA